MHAARSIILRKIQSRWGNKSSLAVAFVSMHRQMIIGTRKCACEILCCYTACWMTRYMQVSSVLAINLSTCTTRHICRSAAYLQPLNLHDTSHAGQQRTCNLSTCTTRHMQVSRVLATSQLARHVTCRSAEYLQPLNKKRTSGKNTILYSGGLAPPWRNWHQLPQDQWQLIKVNQTITVLEKLVNKGTISKWSSTYYRVLGMLPATNDWGRCSRLNTTLIINWYTWSVYSFILNNQLRSQVWVTRIPNTSIKFYGKWVLLRN